LRYETYANHPYSPREQINLFIRELSPTFMLLSAVFAESWTAGTPLTTTLPELLKLTSLPNTIERFLLEETGTSPCI
jgi:hypothetical protein